jgi:multidrug efflux system membrane fusion protein
LEEVLFTEGQHVKKGDVLATGTLLLVDNTVDQATSSIRLKASFPNEDEKPWPGDFVNARLPVETRKDVMHCPRLRFNAASKGCLPGSSRRAG